MSASAFDSAGRRRASTCSIAAAHSARLRVNARFAKKGLVVTPMAPRFKPTSNSAGSAESCHHFVHVCPITQSRYVPSAIFYSPLLSCRESLTRLACAVRVLSHNSVRARQSHFPYLPRYRDVLQKPRGCYAGDIIAQPEQLALFKWRRLAPEMILCAVRWYPRYSLSYRDVGQTDS